LVEKLEERTLLSTPTVTVGPNVNVSKEAGNQAEELISINPTNPNDLIAVSNDLTNTGLANDPSWYSMNGGASWTYSPIPNFPGRSPGGDPQVVFDRTGRAVVAFLDFNAANFVGIETAVSTDGGVTWTAGSADQPVAFPDDDREILSVGPDVNNLSQDRFYLT
jgi:hypothetical protein